MLERIAITELFTGNPPCSIPSYSRQYFLIVENQNLADHAVKVYVAGG
jgi:hypothetical protein